MHQRMSLDTIPEHLDGKRHYSLGNTNIHFETPPLTWKHDFTLLGSNTNRLSVTDISKGLIPKADIENCRTEIREKTAKYSPMVHRLWTV